MKKILLFLSILAVSLTTYAQVGISTATPNASAVLDITSTTKGFLPPRMTEAQMNTIASPAFGLVVMCTDCTPKGPYYYNGAVFLNFVNNGISFLEVTNTTTGKTWMDRNLGATQVATSSTDAAAYGDLYQWGRYTDGHEVRTSGSTSTNATTAVSNNGNSWYGLFIKGVSNPFDWLTPQDNNLWQGAAGTNNPCPTGFRLPTEAEWLAERASWSSGNAAGAFGSPLKLVLAGFRNYSNGTITSNFGTYWSSTVAGTDARLLNYDSVNSTMSSLPRAYGLSVRCIKN